MKVEVTNFRGIERFEKELPLRVAVLGPNGAGKSSLKEAVKAAFTGKMNATDIRRGTARADAEVSFPEWSVGVRRGINAKANEARLDGKASTAKKVREAFRNNGYDPEYFVGQLGLEYFQNADRGNLSALLMGAVNAREKRESLLSAAGITLSPEAERRFLDCFSEPLVGSAELTAAYQELYMERRIAKRDLDALERTIPGPVETSDLPDDRKELEQELNAIHQRELSFKAAHDA